MHIYLIARNFIFASYLIICFKHVYLLLHSCIIYLYHIWFMHFNLEHLHLYFDYLVIVSSLYYLYLLLYLLRAVWFLCCFLLDFVFITKLNQIFIITRMKKEEFSICFFPLRMTWILDIWLVIASCSHLNQTLKLINLRFFPFGILS